MIRIGQQFGNFLVKAEIGRGGMGTIYYALDTMLEREVALKVIHEQYTANPQLMERFKIEAMAQARMNHPNIVMIYSFNQIEGQYVIAMEFIYGKSLRDLLHEKKMLDVDLAINYLEQVLDGLVYAHAHKVIHRDIKPANILVSRDNQVKISDFGIAKIFGSEGLTKTGMLVGTPWYTSPEQILGHNIDFRSDLYSLGITFYEMLTGKVPFDSENNSEFQIQKAHLETPPTRPSVYNPLIGAEIEKFILKALQKNPDKRFQTAQEMKEELKKLKKEITRITTGVQTSGLKKTLYKEKKVERPRFLFWLLPLLAVVIGVGYFLLNRSGQSKEIISKNEKQEQGSEQLPVENESKQPEKSLEQLPQEKGEPINTQKLEQQAFEKKKEQLKEEKQEQKQRIEGETGSPAEKERVEVVPEDVLVERNRQLGDFGLEIEKLRKMEVDSNYLAAEALADRLVRLHPQSRVFLAAARIKFFLEKFDEAEQLFSVPLNEGFPLDLPVIHWHLEDNTSCRGRWRWNVHRIIFNSQERPDHSFAFTTEMVKSVQSEDLRIVVAIEIDQQKKLYIFSLPEKISSQKKVIFLAKIINKYLIRR